MDNKVLDTNGVTKLITLIKTAIAGLLSAGDVVNNLTSDDVNKPLSAAQGKALKTAIDNKNVAVNVMTAEEVETLWNTAGTESAG